MPMTGTISARGFNTGLSNKLLVLIDGRTVYTPLFSGVEWDVQNVMLADLDRIEVISGPGGTLWGANAVNGVINIISKSAEETQGWYMEGGGGSELRDFGALRYGGTLAPNVYFRVYGTYFDRNNEELTSGNPATDAWSQGKGGFRLDTAGLPTTSYPAGGLLQWDHRECLDSGTGGCGKRRKCDRTLVAHLFVRLGHEPSDVLRPDKPIPAGEWN